MTTAVNFYIFTREVVIETEGTVTQFNLGYKCFVVAVIQEVHLIIIKTNPMFIPRLSRPLHHPYKAIRMMTKALAIVAGVIVHLDQGQQETHRLVEFVLV